ncbi:MAG: ABC transporter permease [Kiritimatiellae bacterium]|nr:ABC transporter permease [Kiritimatiellia bacterium]
MNKTLAVAHNVWLDWMRRKDAYVMLALLCGLLLALTSVNVFELQGTARYALDIGLLLIWGFSWLLALNAGSRELPQEESRGTVFLLLSKPLRRDQLLLGKWLGAWSSACAAVLLFYLATWVLLAAQGVSVQRLLLLQAILLHACAVGAIVALALLCSTRMNRDAAAAVAGVLSAASMLLVPQLPALAVHGSAARATLMQALYYALPHLELFDVRRRLVHEFGTLDAATFLLALLYGSILTAMLLLVAWLAYRRKPFTRDRLSE